MTRITHFTLRLAAAALLCAAPTLPSYVAAASPADKALGIAVYHRDVAGAKTVLADGGNPNIINDATFIDTPTSRYVPTPALELAVDSNNPALVDLLLDHGADVNVRDSYGYTSLLQFSGNVPLAVIQKLIDECADVNALGFNQVPVLTRACVFGRTDIVRLLLAHKAAVDTRGALGNTALMVAAASGHLDIVRLLLTQGAKVYAKNSNQESALTVAASNPYSTVPVIRFLLQEGLDVSQHAADGNTALLGVAYFGCAASVKFLLTHGADVHATDHSGVTALMRAHSGKAASDRPPTAFNQVMVLLRAAGEKR